MRSNRSPDRSEGHTKQRLTMVAMELFGEQGFKATTVAQIEAAAGLSAGSGGLYRHFRSKRQLLEYGLRAQADQGAELIGFIGDPDRVAGLSLTDQLIAIGRAGLRRLEQERDVNRLLLRDLADFPELLELFRRHELDRVFSALVGWLTRAATTGEADVEAVAAVLIDAVSHRWVLTDVFGNHPTGVDETRYLVTAARMAACVLEGSADATSGRRAAPRATRRRR